jgi:hypothetical protein
MKVLELRNTIFQKFLVNTLENIIAYCGWPVDHFALRREHHEQMLELFSKPDFVAVMCCLLINSGSEA